MNKTQLVAEVSSEASVDTRTVKAVLEALEHVVVSSVRKGEAVSLPGFVKFSRKDVKAKPARKGINPFTQEPTTFKAKPASKAPRVTVLKRFKDEVARKR